MRHLSFSCLQVSSLTKSVGQGHSGESLSVTWAAKTDPGFSSFLSAQQMTSTKSRCATFTDEADGSVFHYLRVSFKHLCISRYVPSEAVVAIVIKTRQAALRDNDNILGVIRSTNILHNGRSQGMVAPSSSAQALLQRSLLSKASMKPSDIECVLFICLLRLGLIDYQLY